MAYATADQLAYAFLGTEKMYTTNEELKEAIKESIDDTIFYGADDYPELPERRFEKTEIVVNKCRTFETAFYITRNIPEARIAVHNFASATNPGGGVTLGSRAQEESLCRCSTLYPVLNTPENLERYYKFHRDKRDARYTDACIFTPNIVVFKNDSDYVPKPLTDDRWIYVDVISCAAPNLRKKPSPMRPEKDALPDISDEELLAIHEKRARHMFTVLAHNEVDVVITGAFGCGAFQNNPEVVAKAYKNILPEFDGYFQRIMFAIFHTPREVRNYEVFRETFS